MQVRIVRSMLMIALIFDGTLASGEPFLIGGDARVDPADFEITTFASGLDFPFGLAVLQDGSLLVGVNSPPLGGSFFGASGALLRLVDADGDGVADSEGDLLYTGLPRFTTSVRLAGDLVFVATGSPGIFVLRQGATPASLLTLEGSVEMSFPVGWSHSTINLTVREEPGQPGRYEVYFNVGSRENNAASAEFIAVTGLMTGSVAADSLYRLIVDDTGPTLAASGLEQIASGLRNAFGTAFEPLSGDLYIQDNGIDGLIDVNEPLSADELNRIPKESIGGTVENFGFPNRYVEYRTGTLIGSGGIDPDIAFQLIPMPNGAESEGPADVVFAPPQFPLGLSEGVFIGFHGRFSTAGLVNEENPLVYVDLDSGTHFHFIANDEPNIGHPDTLATSEDALYVADLSSANDLSTAGSGSVYRILARPSAVPAVSLGGLALLIALLPLVAKWIRLSGQ